MYFGILKSKGNKRTKNIGDYIQALSALLYVPAGHTTFYLDREQLNVVESKEEGKIKTIMNAWFMTNPTHFPPSDAIMPLYVSFHLNPKIAPIFFSDVTIKHLKKNEPIGCRDTGTVKLMEQHGIKAYFSGCLTLTIGMKSEYKHVSSSSDIYIVDPYCDKIMDLDVISSIRQFFRLAYSLVFKRQTILKISEQIAKTTFKYKDKKKRFNYAARIFATYSSLFEDEVLINGIYEDVRIPVELIPTEEEKIEYAKMMMKKYANAKYVITSRIHCALPCIGIGTPVIFTYSPHMERLMMPTRPSGRLGGILDFFRKVTVLNGKCTTDSSDFPIKTKIGINYSFENKPHYKPYAESLYRSCLNFFEV